MCSITNEKYLRKMNFRSDDELWCHVVRIVEKYWKSRANSRPVIKQIFDSWIELNNEIVQQEDKIRDIENDKCDLKSEIKNLRKIIKQKDELIVNSTERIKELEAKQNVEKAIDKRQVEKELNIHNRRLWDKAWGLVEKYTMVNDKFQGCVVEIYDYFVENEKELYKKDKQITKQDDDIGSLHDTICELEDTINNKNEMNEQSLQRIKELEQMKIEKLNHDLYSDKEKVNHQLEEKINELANDLKLKHEMLLTQEKVKTQQLQERLESNDMKLSNIQETVNMLVDIVIKKQKSIDTEDDMKKHVVEKNIVVTSEDKTLKQNCKQQVVKVSHCTYCKKTGHSKKNCYKLRKSNTICYNCFKVGHIMRHCKLLHTQIDKTWKDELEDKTNKRPRVIVIIKRDNSNRFTNDFRINKRQYNTRCYDNDYNTIRNFNRYQKEREKGESKEGRFKHSQFNEYDWRPKATRNLEAPWRVY